MQFDCHIDPLRFWFIIDHLRSSNIVKNFYPQKIRKTACFYGEKLNVYIDASDGQAKEYGQLEYCDRILRVVEDTQGKPFLFFKNWYSPTLCTPIEKVANENNGKVIPFMYWSSWPHFRDFLWPNIHVLRAESSLREKVFDIGVCARPETRTIPRPSVQDKRISWGGYEWFGFGKSENTGYYEHNARIVIPEKLKNSKFTFDHVFNIDFQEYIERSMSWKALVDIPGVACVSHRMLENGWLGQCIILGKNDVDFAFSWKKYYPEVDFSSPGWEEEVGNIIENYEEWRHRILYYLETFCTPAVITGYLIHHIYKNVDLLS